ncbi:MAG: GNAT family N-acetyltransferase [Alphaproteobacteria bacterium]|nr:GNAT family N-acetyltransferase [Alphaproteobacteria bacterium]
MAAIEIRDAVAADLPAVQALLAQDARGPSPPAGADEADALARIAESPDNRLLVAEAADGRIVGTFQITRIPYLSAQGGDRLLVEGVRVAADRRGEGIGETMLRWAVEAAQAQGCRLVQLMAHDSRDGAARFYRRLGFASEHRGFRLYLDRA